MKKILMVATVAIAVLMLQTNSFALDATRSVQTVHRADGTEPMPRTHVSMALSRCLRTFISTARSPCLRIHVSMAPSRCPRTLVSTAPSPCLRIHVSMAPSRCRRTPADTNTIPVAGGDD